MADQLDAVAQPLHGRAGDEDAALHRVADLAVQAVADRGQQAVLRHHRGGAGVLDHEATGAIGALDHAGLEAGLADQRGLLVAGHAQHRDSGAEQFGLGAAEIGGAVEHLRQQAARNVEQRQQLLVPLLAVDVEQQGARGIAGVGAMRLATAQTPQQEAVDGAEAQFAALGALAGARHAVENPAQLGGGKVGVDQQAGLLRHPRFVTGGFQPGTVVGGAAVLPDDGRMDRCAGRGIPDDGGLALVGDADGQHLLGPEPLARQHLTTDLEGAQPDLFGVVLDPAILGEVLLELALGTGQVQTLGTEDNGAGAGGALVDGKQVVGHTVFLVVIRSHPSPGGRGAEGEGAGHSRPMAAKLPWVCWASTSAASSTSSPRRPALTWMVGCWRALSSMKVRRRFFCPSGLMPPTR